MPFHRPLRRTLRSHGTPAGGAALSPKLARLVEDGGLWKGFPPRTLPAYTDRLNLRRVIRLLYGWPSAGLLDSTVRNLRRTPSPLGVGPRLLMKLEARASSIIHRAGLTPTYRAAHAQVAQGWWTLNGAVPETLSGSSGSTRGFRSRTLRCL